MTRIVVKCLNTTYDTQNQFILTVKRQSLSADNTPAN